MVRFGVMRILFLGGLLAAVGYGLTSLTLVIFLDNLAGGVATAGFSGVMMDSIGYASFFSATAATGIPSLILILIAWKVMPSKQ